MLKHIVCWKIKEEAERSTKQENLHKMKQMLEDLPSKIDVINSLEVGLNFNPSETSFDISLYSSFQDQATLDIYQKHSAHMEIATFIKSITTDRAVVDYFD